MYSIPNQEIHMAEEENFVDNNNKLDEEEQSTSSAEIYTRDKVRKSTFQKVNWIMTGIDLTFTESEWKIIFENNVPQKKSYVAIITKKMEEHFSCVLMSKGFYAAANICTLRFQCVFPKCRKYKLVHYYGNETPFQFSVFYDSNNIKHPSKLKSTKLIRKSFPLKKSLDDNHHEDSKKCTLSNNLKRNDNYYTLRKRSLKASSLQDFHKDDIEKLNSLMIHQEKKDKKNQYVRYIINNPFGIYMFSQSQLDIIRHCSRFQELTVHVDATSSLIQQSPSLDEHILYYVCLVSLNSFLLSEEYTELPICEMINSSHNAFSIKTWLNHFKFNFMKCHNSWPCFRHIVSNFNYDILNAISEGLNECKLIDYLNLAYHSVVFKTNFNLINMHLCCDHLMKSMISDVENSYERLERTNRKFIMTVLMSLYNISNIEKIEYVLRRLSTLLTAKFYTRYVELCKRELEETILNSVEHEFEDVEYFYVSGDVISQEEKLDYSNSSFFQHFSHINNEYDSILDVNDNLSAEKINPFCNHHLFNILLQKYISILPLWTPILLQTPMKFSNGDVENYFGQIKERCLRKSYEIGNPPYKCSTFLNETRAYINEAEKHFCYIPKLTLHEGTELLDSKENVTLVNLELENDNIGIDDTTIPDLKTSLTKHNSHKRIFKEEINSKIDGQSSITAKKHCYKHKSVPPVNFYRKKIASIIETQALYHITGRTIIKSESEIVNYMKNGLKCDIHFYIGPILKCQSIFEQCNYVVARRGNLTLFLDNYYSLYGKQHLTNFVIEYILAILISGKEEFQMIPCEIGTAIFSDRDLQYVSMLKIYGETKMLFIPINEQRCRWILLILDLQDRIFYCCDSMSPSGNDEYFKLFLETDFGAAPIGPSNTWRLGSYERDCQEDDYNSGIYLVHYVEQAVSLGCVMSSEDLFDPDIYRFILLEYILHTSDDMQSNCLMCGSLHYYEREMASWIQCEKCNRWLHISCLNKKDGSIRKLSDYEHKQFLCFLCS
ncbi:uncharacterized protein LOC111642683 isoform X1 [Centruroides sculpturatus]|uniref:uncharacterized protein LOC111642683 isoform X1 n=1 Tax=Centruroides sculpturatus TaxID=218467 RepID=UPI000C6DBD35|nr:uncharacterized protein LOC111642683 isoform X1 [Centruroides sculpturatus]XP_023244831.1 uncharacterized protein LOC111642683 isoform X1 [Centruroides sculpturatus]